MQTMGMTEGQWLASVVTHPDEWAYYYFHPRTGVEMRPYSEDLSELVFVQNPKLTATQPVFKTFPELDIWETKDFSILLLLRESSSVIHGLLPLTSLAVAGSKQLLFCTLMRPASTSQTTPSSTTSGQHLKKLTSLFQRSLRFTVTLSRSFELHSLVLPRAPSLAMRRRKHSLPTSTLSTIGLLMVTLLFASTEQLKM
ncbi:hypothetical protein LB505_009749 [Fusarium chuoi]|nr:hypothetical protein LB505_009749 [Fusarium chuoi]